MKSQMKTHFYRLGNGKQYLLQKKSYFAAALQAEMAGHVAELERVGSELSAKKAAYEELGYIDKPPYSLNSHSAKRE